MGDFVVYLEEVYGRDPDNVDLAEVESYKRRMMEPWDVREYDSYIFVLPSIRILKRKIIEQAMRQAGVDEELAEYAAGLSVDAKVVHLDGEGAGDLSEEVSDYVSVALNWGESALVCGGVEAGLDKAMALFKAGFQPIGIQYVLIASTVLTESEAQERHCIDCGIWQWNAMQQSEKYESGKAFIVLRRFGETADGRMSPAANLNASIGFGPAYDQFNVDVMDDFHIPEDNYEWRQRQIEYGPSLHVMGDTPEPLVTYAIDSLRLEYKLRSLKSMSSFLNDIDFRDALSTRIPFLIELASCHSELDYEDFRSQCMCFSALPIERDYSYGCSDIPDPKLPVALPASTRRIIWDWLFDHPESQVIRRQEQPSVALLSELEGLAQVCIQRLSPDQISGLQATESKDITMRLLQEVPCFADEIECVCQGVPLEDLYPDGNAYAEDVSGIFKQDDDSEFDILL